MAKSYNATKMFEATGYTEHGNAFWVRVNGTSPEVLRRAPGVVGVIVLRGATAGLEEQAQEPNLAFLLVGLLVLPGLRWRGLK